MSSTRKRPRPFYVDILDQVRLINKNIRATKKAANNLRTSSNLPQDEIGQNVVDAAEEAEKAADNMELVLNTTFKEEEDKIETLKTKNDDLLAKNDDLLAKNKALTVENKALTAENKALKDNNDELKKQIMLPNTEALEPLKIVGEPLPLAPPPLAPPPPMPPLPGALKSKDWREDYAAGIAKAAAAKEAEAAAAATHVDTPEEEEEKRKRAKKKVEAMASAHARARAAVLGLSAPSENFTVSSREISDALSKLSKSKRSKEFISPRQLLTQEKAMAAASGRTPSVERSAAPTAEQKSTRSAIKASIHRTDTSEIKSLQQIREEAAERKTARDAAKKKDIFDKKKAVFENPFSAGGKGTRRRYNNYKKTRKGRLNNRRRKIKSRKIKTIRRKQ